ncbi:MAG TPA: glycoside hydrolase family 38 C-terminal domain-containing protein, partial [Longimicrobiales bacterium]
MSEPVQVGDGPIHVTQTTAEKMFLDIRPEWYSRLPRYTGDLELIEHSAGSLTSEAYMKRWNRQNEVLADAAERASVAAMWLGRSYPQKRLNDAWTLVMGGQFHDIIPGTSLPKAYEYAWNDQLLALNQFSAVLSSATEKVASGLDTRVTGTPVVVYNPLNVAREDVVEAALPFPTAPAAVRVLGPDGREVPAQLSNGKVLFLARVPAVGWSVYDVRPAEKPAQSTALAVTESSLENERYRVRLDASGDVASVFDKSLGKELLAAPARLAISTDKPAQWPAWNMDWTDQSKPPRAFVSGPARVRIVESGPARVAVEVTRETEGSRFVQTIRLAAGSGRLEFANAIDWRTPSANLKATFPLTATNPKATYNWDVGTIERGNDDPRKFEVASHQWVDLTDKGGQFGVTVLTDAKNGSDKPDDATLRLTLVRTPGISAGWEEYGDQSSQDFGHHEIVYGLAGHGGDWRQSAVWEALRLNQPLAAFTTGKHAGALGKQLSFLTVGSPAVRVLALKKAEASDEVVIRLVETQGRPQTRVAIGFAAPIMEVRPLNGQELPIKANLTLDHGKLLLDFTPYQPRTFAVRLGPATTQLTPTRAQPVRLAYDVAGAGADGVAARPGFDASGRALPGEMLPGDLEYGGIHFKLAP